MTDAVPIQAETQADRLAAAKIKQKQREDGIRAQAIGEGRRLEREDILKQIGAQAIEDVRLSAEMKTAHAGELQRLHRQYDKHTTAHGFGMLMFGLALGAMLAGSAAAYGTWNIAKDAQLTNAAARGIEHRGGYDVPRLTITEPGDDGEDQGVRRGREPESAR